jgi:hypothetical protein
MAAIPVGFFAQRTGRLVLSPSADIAARTIAR